MANDLLKLLADAPIVPLVKSDDPDEAVAITRSLIDGGLQVIEVVLRTDNAFECLAAICKAYPEHQVGAGTVLSAEQANKAIKCGAKFIVSPGLDEGVVNVALKNELPILPGIQTATELQRAWNMGLRTVKFFPASLSGGLKMLKALSSIFRDMSFMPTGGVNADNLNDYLSVPAVIACGGSWMTPVEAVQSKDFEVIENLARIALNIAKEG